MGTKVVRFGEEVGYKPQIFGGHISFRLLIKPPMINRGNFCSGV
jgi:hypothetical protein